MKTEQFLERYKKAIERLTILCSLSEEQKSSLKETVDFNMEIIISDDGDKVTVGEFLNSFNADVIKSFVLNDYFLQAIGGVLAGISDEQIERLIVECEELFTDNGLAQAEIAMEQIQVALFESSLAADFQKIASEEFGLAKESGEGLTMTPMQSVIYVFHGDVFQKLMSAQAIRRNLAGILRAFSSLAK